MVKTQVQIPDVLFREAKRLAAKEQVVVITKMDLPQTQQELPGIKAWFEQQGIKVFPISSATGEGVETLLDEIARRLWGKAEEAW